MRNENAEVHYVGKIDREIFCAIFSDIVTDEVIITDERIQHIRLRHPNDFERYERYLREIVENPDYIMGANKPNSAILLKEFHEGSNQFQAILRLHTSTDDPAYKNSIITFMRLNESRYKTYTRTKKVLYKRA